MGLLICAIAWKRRLIYVVVGKEPIVDCDRHPYALKKMQVRITKDNCNHISMLPWNDFSRDTVIKPAKQSTQVRGLRLQGITSLTPLILR